MSDITAVYMAKGLIDVGELGSIVKHGEVEFFNELIQYAPYADKLYDAGARVTDGAGCFAYEVAEPFGEWFALTVLGLSPGDAPSNEVCCQKLRELVLVYFTHQGHAGRVIDIADALNAVPTKE